MTDMTMQNSEQATPQQGWLYLTGSGDDVQQHGPFDLDAMKGAFYTVLEARKETVLAALQLAS